ncbi:MAG: amino-acid N-acetyltransferase [Pseudomonadales bacterium]|nr:amino-acid N-acetyltransferase [Pseudomonadales bacterium]
MSDKEHARRHVKWFRDSSPYINAHRGRTFVIYVDGAGLSHDNFPLIIQDIVLLHSLGVRIVLVYGATPQINRSLARRGIVSESVEGIRITTAEMLPHVQEVVGRLRSDIESMLSMGATNSPQHGADIAVVSGNVIRARPLGVRDGIDFHNTGEIRRVNADLIARLLSMRTLLLVSPLGYSLSGQMFNLHGSALAAGVAAALGADKLIYLASENGVKDSQGDVITELQADAINPDEYPPYSPVAQAREACLRGVPRCHLISFRDDGSLLEELFTRDGIGTQITETSYEQIRAAAADDISGIMELLAPLEASGTLLKRPREVLETEISRFLIIERDGMVVGCAALYPYDTRAELACLATHPDYRNDNRGEILLDAIEANARTLGVKTIFALTTHTAQWFSDHGFIPGSTEDLPSEKRALYNYQRNSKVLVKTL